MLQQKGTAKIGAVHLSIYWVCADGRMGGCVCMRSPTKKYGETRKQHICIVATLSVRALHFKLAASRQSATCSDMPAAKPKANARSVHKATTKSHRTQQRNSARAVEWSVARWEDIRRVRCILMTTVMMMSSVMPKPKLQQMKAHSAKTCISAYWKAFAGAEIRARAAEKSRKKDKKLSRGRVHNNMKWKE